MPEPSSLDFGLPPTERLAEQRVGGLVRHASVEPLEHLSEQRLVRRGKAKVKAKVTFTPDGGEANTQSTTVTLKRDR